MAGPLAALMPAVMARLVDLCLLRMDPVNLIGAMAGSRESTPSMTAIEQNAKSTVPSINYPLLFAQAAMIMLFYGCISMMNS